jgi:hypothetical protein
VRVASLRRRRWPVVAAAIAVAAVVAGGVVLATRGNDDAASHSLPASTVPASTVPGQDTLTADAEYAPHPERRFIRVGTDNGEQFTDEEFQTLAREYDIVLLAKFHAGYDIAKQHEAAQRLHELRPDIEVYPYWSTKYWFDKDKQMGLEFNDDWYLRDNDGNVIIRSKRGEERSKYVDLANPAYREWALGVLASWLKAAPYAGLSFDAAEPIGDYREDDIRRWDELLGPERVRAYNDGMRDLLRRAHELVGPDRKVLYNGYAPNELRGPGRNLDLLDFTDGALTERFCIGPKGKPEGVPDDLTIMREHPNKQLFVRSNYRENFGDRNRYERLCFGAFLLGWEPGRSYYQFGSDYTAAQLHQPAPDLDVNLGQPSGEATDVDGVSQRAFEHGTVLVNLSSQPASVPAPLTSVQVRDGNVVGTYERGQELTVPAFDAVFLLEPRR